jgi:hypothetical protein
MSLKEFERTVKGHRYTRSQDERLISRSQRDFTGGMFSDVTSTQIPPNGVAYLKNYKNLGFALEGRTGSRTWGDLVNKSNMLLFLLLII